MQKKWYGRSGFLSNERKRKTIRRLQAKYIKMRRAGARARALAEERDRELETTALSNEEEKRGGETVGRAQEGGDPRRVGTGCSACRACRACRAARVREFESGALQKCVTSVETDL